MMIFNDATLVFSFYQKYQNEIFTNEER